MSNVQWLYIKCKRTLIMFAFPIVVVYICVTIYPELTFEIYVNGNICVYVNCFALTIFYQLPTLFSFKICVVVSTHSFCGFYLGNWQWLTTFSVDLCIQSRNENKQGIMKKDSIALHDIYQQVMQVVYSLMHFNKGVLYIYIYIYIRRF